MRYLSAIIMLLLLSACDKGPEVICDPGGDMGLESVGFFVVDSNGRNLLDPSVPNRMDTTTIKVWEPCINRYGRDEAGYEGILQFHVSIRPVAGKPCNTAIVHWRTNDSDTITFNSWPQSDGCSGTAFRIDEASIRLNGQPLVRDTSRNWYSTHIYRIRK